MDEQNEWKCPQCGRELDYSPAVCPQCEADLPESEMTPKKTRTKKNA